MAAQERCEGEERMRLALGLLAVAGWIYGVYLLGAVDEEKRHRYPEHPKPCTPVPTCARSDLR